MRGTLDEPGTAKVSGQPAHMLAGNTFETTIQATPGSNTLTVEATDVSGNVTAKRFQVDVSATGASYSYDSNGSFTTKTEGTDTWGYEWNASNQLTRVTKNSIEQARFSYDPIGRRVEKVAGGVTTAYAYDGIDILRETRGSTTLKYLHGPDIDEALAQEDGTGALSYYHADWLGSIVKVTSTTGAIALTRQYDGWGDLEVGASESGYAFTGREWDPEAGLYYYRARYYDPKNGRFVSQDPIRFHGGDNFYLYAGANSVTGVDPFGLAIFVKGCSPPPPLPAGAGGFARFMHAIAMIAHAINPCGILPVPAVLDIPEAACRVGAFTLTQTVAQKAASRPYVNSPLAIREVMQAGKPIPDPGGIPGALRWDVPGGYLPATKCCPVGTPPTSGTWELVVGPDNTIYHFLFRGQ